MTGGYGPAALSKRENVHRSTLEALTDWTIAADKTLVF